ncbi:MAG: hypothetical protein JWN23_1536 [Rhodocyclales bacterium]|nr:hypothetical protein [Rhodocyclales bacterium]
MPVTSKQPDVLDLVKKNPMLVTQALNDMSMPASGKPASAPKPGLASLDDTQGRLGGAKVISLSGDPKRLIAAHISQQEYALLAKRNGKAPEKINDERARQLGLKNDPDHEDKVLARISIGDARVLKAAGGSGLIDPDTHDAHFDDSGEDGSGGDGMGTGSGDDGQGAAGTDPGATEDHDQGVDPDATTQDAAFDPGFDKDFDPDPTPDPNVDEFDVSHAIAQNPQTFSLQAPNPVAQVTTNVTPGQPQYGFSFNPDNLSITGLAKDAVTGTLSAAHGNAIGVASSGVSAYGHSGLSYGVTGYSDPTQTDSISGIDTASPGPGSDSGPGPSDASTGGDTQYYPGGSPTFNEAAGGGPMPSTTTTTGSNSTTPGTSTSAAPASDAYTWFKNLYGNLAPQRQDIANAAGTAQTVANTASGLNQTSAATDRATYDANFTPTLNKVVTNANTFDSEGEANRLAQEGEATVGKQYGQQQQALGRQMQSYGINPTSAKYQAQIAGLSGAEASARAAASNSGRIQGRDIGTQRLVQATQLSAPLAGQSTTEGNAGVVASQAGLSAAQVPNATETGAGALVATGAGLNNSSTSIANNYDIGLKSAANAASATGANIALSQAQQSNAQNAANNAALGAIAQNAGSIWDWFSSPSSSSQGSTSYDDFGFH